MRCGDHGETVRDLQRRLTALGYEIPPAEHGFYSDGTESAVRAFQEARGVLVDGICGRHTWAVLVESGFALGDRLLYLRQPMLRGDDISALQGRLNALGFDAGREDGIFGPQAAAAITEFQRNAKIPVDGICGPVLLEALDRLGGLAGGSIAAVRERERLRRQPRNLQGRRVFIAAAPGFHQLAEVITRGLVELRAEVVLDVSGDDDSRVADEANTFEAELVLALQSGDARRFRCAYFQSGQYRSEGGYLMAHAIRDELQGLIEVETCGRAFTILRETRMAAVVCAPVERGNSTAMRRLVERTEEIGCALVEGIRRGFERPASDP